MSPDKNATPRVDSAGSHDKLALRRILLGTDFSVGSEIAQSYAEVIADRYHSELYLVHVIGRDISDLFGQDADALIEQARQRAQEKLRGLSKHDPSHAVIAEGDVAEVLVETIKRTQIDLAVIGTHGRRAFKKLILGSVAEEVFRMATCPVLTVGPKNQKTSGEVRLKHVLYPLEFVPDSSGAARYAVSLADINGANLTIMNVRDDIPPSPSVGEAFNEPVERWIEEHTPPTGGLRERIRFERGFGTAVEAILTFAAKSSVDLIVMSVKTLDPVMAAHFPKSATAYAVVCGAACPVLTVR